MSQNATLSPTPFGRVVTAMVTPFDASGAVDLSVAANLARHLVDQGSDGLLVCGTTGESPTLSWDEQLQLLQAVREAVGGNAKVLAGTGSNCTAEAVEATKEAAAAGWRRGQCPPADKPDRARSDGGRPWRWRANVSCRQRGGIGADGAHRQTSH